MEEQTKDLSDLIDAVKRRRGLLATTAAVVFVVATLSALLWPPTYRSTATILIEAQEIPIDLVRSTITSFATQRIQITSQRVMTRANLLGIIDRYKLYESRRERETTEEIIDRMREDIAVDMVSADVIDPQSGRPATAAIAFTVAFEGEDPGSVQRVANELASLYLSENVKTRTEKAAETTQFLGGEVKRLAEELSDVEQRLAEFKEAHADALPTLTGMNLASIERAETELRASESQIRLLEDRQFYLKSQLGASSPYGSQTQLTELRSTYARAAAQYAPDHPDVVRLKKQIEGMEGEFGAKDVQATKAREVARLREELSQVRERYSEEHPDVVRLQRALDRVEAELAVAPSPVEVEVAERAADNPVYMALKDQLSTAEAQLAAQRALREELRAKIAGLERSMVAAPGVEREFAVLVRERDSLDARYRLAKQKEMEAVVGQSLERESKGERFVLIDPPLMPEKPISPNRPAIFFLGIVLALGGGLGVTAVAEAMDRSIRGAKGVIQALNLMPLAVIPYQFNEAEHAGVARRRSMTWAVLVGGLVLGLIVVHFFVSPLDVMWFRVLRKGETMIP